MKLRRLLVFLFAPACVGLAASAPDWVEAVRRAPVTVSVGEAEAVLLLVDSSVQIDAEGNRTTRVRQVLKVLSAEGRKLARARAGYSQGHSEVESFKAWLISPSGTVLTYGKKDIVDVADFDNAQTLYADARSKHIDATPDADTNAVFAYEFVKRSRTVFRDFDWSFRGRLPVQRSSLEITVSPGWQIVAHNFNGAAVQPLRTNNTYVWRLDALPALPDEVQSPSARAASEWLALDIVAPPGSSAERRGIDGSSWNALSRQFTPRYDESGRLDESLRAKAQDLTAGAANDWEKIQRLATFVQRVNYISIQLNSGRAGGLFPRPASQVLQCNYGDCKDKANLLRSLLSAVGVRSHPLIVRADGSQRIEASWPSPTQFDHCILAIELPADQTARPVITHPRLGRLLIFDPTDPDTPFGALASESLADDGLLLAGEAGDLVRLPGVQFADHSISREVRAELDSGGNLRATLDETTTGAYAATARREFRQFERDDYRRLIERWLGATLPALREVQVNASDHFPEQKFTLEAKLLSVGYARLMRDQLIIFRPVIVARRDFPRLPKKERTLPVALSGQAYRDRAEFTLPPNCVVDELPRTLELRTEWADYRVDARVQDGRVIYERTLNVQPVELPPSAYESVRTFFEKIYQSEQSPVVLRRQKKS